MLVEITFMLGLAVPDFFAHASVHTQAKSQSRASSLASSSGMRDIVGASAE
jgi:hypothetical protein